MRIVLDIEANGLFNPTKVWLVVAKNIDSGELHIFRRPSDDEAEKARLVAFFGTVTQYVGHNILEYDLPVLGKLLGLSIDTALCLDTLIISRLVDYSRDQGHSIEAYGEEFGFPKLSFSDFTKYSKEMEDYCVRDVEICSLILSRYSGVVSDPGWQNAIQLEHAFQGVVNRLHDNGFCFDLDRASKLLLRVDRELKDLDTRILAEFPPRLKPVREVHPKVTKHGTLSKADFRFVKDGNLGDYNGGPFTRCEWVQFNPASHKQLVEVLHEAGWKPTEKTKTHIDTERSLQRASWGKTPISETVLRDLEDKLSSLKKFGWKITENNLATLPSSAPAPAKTLAKRILLESRRRTLTEWISLVSPQDNRIHGKFVGIGAWTHRMAHQNPNTANIPTEAKLFGKEMRQLWRAPKDRLLVGVDAEGIQLRIFAHYIDDPEFTDALVRGRKDDKTDPHSLNQRVLGRICKSRAVAKRFIYALLLGAGLGKLSEILDCSKSEAQEALDRVLERYTGFGNLKREVLPQDGKRGWFVGLDGRRVSIPGETPGSRTHLAMSGYLQNGEAIVMKKACLLWHEQLARELGADAPIIVNFVHDEWQSECKNDPRLALKIADIQAGSLKIVGEELKLRCPLAGSYWNDDHKDYTIGVNWYQTH